MNVLTLFTVFGNKPVCGIEAPKGDRCGLCSLPLPAGQNKNGSGSASAAPSGSFIMLCILL